MLNYELKGEGPYLLLIHGFLCTSSAWELMVSRLEKSYELILIDLPGHGDSKDILCDDIEQMAKQIKLVLDKLGISQCSVLGHSMGGYVALELANCYPNLIKELNLIHSTPFADSSEKKRQRQRAINAVKKTHRLFVSQFIPKLFAIQNIQKCIIYIADLEKEAMMVSKECIIKSLEAMRSRKDLSDVIESWPFKTRIILGLDDPVIDSEVIMARYSQSPNVEVSCISETGHMGFYECPDKCSALLLA